jgi:hypothetical protein
MLPSATQLAWIGSRLAQGDHLCWPDRPHGARPARSSWPALSARSASSWSLRIRSWQTPSSSPGWASGAAPPPHLHPSGPAVCRPRRGCARRGGSPRSSPRRPALPRPTSPSFRQRRRLSQSRPSCSAVRTAPPGGKGHVVRDRWVRPRFAPAIRYGDRHRMSTRMHDDTGRHRNGPNRVAAYPSYGEGLDGQKLRGTRPAPPGGSGPREPFWAGPAAPLRANDDGQGRRRGGSRRRPRSCSRSSPRRKRRPPRRCR